MGVRRVADGFRAYGLGRILSDKGESSSLVSPASFGRWALFGCASNLSETHCWLERVPTSFVI